MSKGRKDSSDYNVRCYINLWVKFVIFYNFHVQLVTYDLGEPSSEVYELYVTYLFILYNMYIVL